MTITEIPDNYNKGTNVARRRLGMPARACLRILRMRDMDTVILQCW